MLGKIDGPNMIVMDAFALPVEGTETRVNAQAAAYEYMSIYIEAAKKVKEREVGREMVTLLLTGWSFGECHWVVSQSPWLRLLVVWY